MPSVFVKEIQNQADGLTLLVVHYGGVYLRCGNTAMPEKFKASCDRGSGSSFFV